MKKKRRKRGYLSELLRTERMLFVYDVAVLCAGFVMGFFLIYLLFECGGIEKVVDFF